MRDEMFEGMFGEMVEGAASALWVSEWASAWESAVEMGEADDLPWGPGDAIEDAAPPVPDEAYEIAARLLMRVDRDNSRGPYVAALALLNAYADAREAKYDAPRDAEHFGWQLAMQWLGHGVGLPSEVDWLKVGHGEFIVNLDPETEEAEVGYSSI